MSTNPAPAGGIGFIAWSWLWVLAPIWIGFILILAVFAVALTWLEWWK